MKRLMVTIAILALFLAIVPIAVSADKILEATITNVVEKVDKNGSEYVRFIIDEVRTLQGVEYMVGVPLMAFGDLVPKAQSYSNGDIIRCIVQSREYQGRQSYTILAFM